MNKTPMRHIDKLSLFADSEYAFISPAAHYGLELEDLVLTLDKTMTPFGKRLLKSWLYHPLKDAEAIKKRQEAVTLLRDNERITENLSRLLSHIPDIEKCIYRISSDVAQARDMIALRNTLTRIPEIKSSVVTLSERNFLFSIKDLPGLTALLDSAIDPNAPLTNSEGKLIKKGFNKELDELRDIQENGQEWLKNFQEREIKRSGINSLKVGFNSVFGYYIVISNSNLPHVPQDYIRKQTLVNAERFITPELKEFEVKMLTAQEKIFSIEQSLLKKLQQQVLDVSIDLHTLCQNIATIDALYSFCILSKLPGYIIPSITNGTEINIANGRHPVVEARLDANFVPNDILLDCTDNHLLMITGPNMAGKSTYIRQVAILSIMAQAGSYIPASQATIGIIDKIFTRIGAHDDISKGQSTFMVEMSQTAEILNNLSARSLVILDEVGRGTSTYDGLSLAWAIAEFLAKHKVRTLFATHFHELTVLADGKNGIKNYNIAVKEWKDEIIFLHKITAGGCDDSFGIYVAKLAGIPKEVIKRGSEILTQLELSGAINEKITQKEGRKEVQLSLFAQGAKDAAGEEIKQALKDIDINALSPIEALNKINEWKKLIDDRK